MEGYLGEFDIDIQDTEYREFKSNDWALLWIEMYGQIDGAHHKQWVLDQVARILCGTKVIVKVARWENGHEEFRFNLSDKPNIEYNMWVQEQLGDKIDGEYEYSYDEGIAP